VETGAVISVANVHSGPLAHGIEAFQDLDRVSAVGVLIGVGCHRPDIGIYGRKSRARTYARTRESRARIRHLSDSFRQIGGLSDVSESDAAAKGGTSEKGRRIHR
jgi:hypothetical protein